MNSFRLSRGYHYISCCCIQSVIFKILLSVSLFLLAIGSLSAAEKPACDIVRISAGQECEYKRDRNFLAFNEINLSDDKVSKYKYADFRKEGEVDGYSDYTEEIMQNYCPNGVCECRETKTYLEIPGDTESIKRINAKEKEFASQLSCNIDSSIIKYNPHFAFLSDGIVSFVYDKLNFCLGCGGSCHGNQILRTYDIRAGKLYTLGDVVDPQNYDALANALTEQFMHNPHASGGYKEEEIKDETLGIIKRHVLKSDTGIYVENGRVFINLDTFMLGCAGGSFYPLEIPTKFVTGDIRNKL